MNTDKVKRLEYFIDIFKGTCELNNFHPIMMPIMDGAKPRSSHLDVVTKSIDSLKENKLYFNGPVVDAEEYIELGAVISGYGTNSYRVGELINLANKTLYNADIYETSILIDSKDKALLENLDMIDQVVKETEVQKNDADKDLAFEIIAEDRTVVRGGGSNGLYYFIINYSAVEDLLDYDYKNTLDVFISPKTAKVLDDAFVISTNLKDAGFKVEIDFEMSKCNVDSIPADFLITIDEEDIAKYTVKLKDLKTKEERDVMIDNLVEELFI